MAFGGIKKTTNGQISQRTLGSTGEQVSIVGLGGAHIARQDGRRAAVRLIRAAIDAGINFMDNCWDYHGGNSERWMGDALRDGYRDRVFLMTKIDAREATVARRQIDQSLERLQTDHVDLLQLHEVIRPDDPGRAFAPGGVIEALDEARQAGKARYIGFTGHKDPAIHLKMLAQGYAWDTVQMPVNILDLGFNSFQLQVLPVLNQQGIGVLAMKPFAGGRLFDTGVVNGVEALRYVFGLDVDVVINGMENMRDLSQALAAAVDFKPLSRIDLGELQQRISPFSRDGAYERYKTSHDFDGTYHHPHWLVEARV